MAVFFLFLRNVLLPIEILKIKILEHSDPPSQHFSVHKAFSHFYFCRGKVMLCHLAEWHNMKLFNKFITTIRLMKPRNEAEEKNEDSYRDNTTR